MTEKKHRRAVLYLGLLLTIVLILNQGLSFYINATQTFKGTMVTESGETLNIEVKCDSGRPPSFLNALLMNTQRVAWRAWTMIWTVGTNEVTTVDSGLSITVTGANVQSTATVDYYIKAVSASDSQKWTKELDMTGASITVGGAAHDNSTGSALIETHLGNMGLAIDQNQTIDYYIYVKAVTTGIISGENVVVEITEIKFDTVAYLYGGLVSTTLRPNEAGDVTGAHVQYPSSGQHWDKTDEAVADYATTYIRISGSSGGGNKYSLDLFEIPDHTTESGVINAVIIYATSWHDYNRGWIKTTIRTGGYDFIGADWGGNGVWTKSDEIYATNPDTSAAWTWAEIDDLQVGVSMMGAFDGFVRNSDTTQVYAEVAYESYEASWSWYRIPPLSVVSMPLALDLMAVMAVAITAFVIIRKERS